MQNHSTGQPESRLTVPETRLALRGKRLVGFIGAAALAVSGLAIGHNIRRDMESDQAPNPNAAHRVVTLDTSRPTRDNLWDLAESAFPGDNPAGHIGMLEQQVPAGQQPQDGEQFNLPMDAQIGKIVDPTAPKG